MKNNIEQAQPAPENGSRWQFFRDVLVFQGKLVVDGLRDLTLSPVSIVAALMDVIKGGRRPGRHFYDVVHFGRQTEQWINLFEAADRAPEKKRPRPGIDLPSVDEFVNRFEDLIREEYRKGDLSASAKYVVDQTLATVERIVKAESGKRNTKSDAGAKDDHGEHGNKK